MYKYGMRFREFTPDYPPLIGLMWREDDPSGIYHDILVYNRPLNDHEQEEYELDYLGEIK